MGNSTGAPQFPDLLRNCVLWYTGCHSAAVSGDFDEFPIIPSGVTVTNNPVSSGWIKDDLGNNKSVMRFDGTANYVSLSDNDAFYYDADSTVVFWVKLNSIYGTDQVNAIIGQGSVFASLYYIGFSKNGTTYSFFWRSRNAGTQNWFMGVSTGISLNTWMCFACVRSGSNVYMYLNGLQGATSAVTGSTLNLSGNISIGHINITDMADFNYYLDGNIKDLMIYKGRALTVPELKLLMARTHPITGLGLMPNNGKYWRLS